MQENESAEEKLEFGEIILATIWNASLPIRMLLKGIYQRIMLREGIAVVTRTSVQYLDWILECCSRSICFFGFDESDVYNFKSCFLLNDEFAHFSVRKSIKVQKEDLQPYFKKTVLYLLTTFVL